MIEIVEVKTKKQQKLFVDFPTKLYDGCPQYVHPLRIDELNLFNRNKNASYEDCDAVYFLAYKDGELAGRIAVIIQKLYNQKVGEKRARFSRFDSINDQEVANALFEAGEKWAKENGMEIIHGPLGFNDLDREGLLVDGFEHLATFEEQYNYEYYQTLIENYGFEKEKDWVEFKIYPPKEIDPRVARLSEAVLKRYKLKLADTNVAKGKFINHYKQGIFEVLDLAYRDLHGTIPFTPKLRDQIISQFKLFIKLKYIVVLVDENDRVVAFGFALPSIARAVQKSKGRLTPRGIWGIMRSASRLDIVDFGLVGVLPEYQGKGLTAVILKHIMQTMIE
ncbi:MAG: hypothetical protein IKT27_04270, partial [Clostridia bacterium]|nr:hypothetical protein [Clostridia bacterium]